MNDELRVAFSKKEKVELFLANLDKLKAEGSVDGTLYQDLSAEYIVILEEVNSSIKSIKAKLRKELDRKAEELDTLQKERDLLEARFSVGEMRSQAYWAQAKPLEKKIGQLKKEVPKLRVQVNATSSAELGGPTRVDIPKLKVKKAKPKVIAVEKAVGNTPVAKRQETVPSRGETRLIKVLKEIATKTTLPRGRHSISISGIEYTTEKIGNGRKKEKEYPVGGKGVITGAQAAIVVIIALIIVVAVFAISRLLVPADRTVPTITELAFSRITESSVTIEWMTDEKTSSQVVLLDPDGVSTSTEPDKNLVTKHSVNVAGVKPDIKYQVTIKSLDAGGNEATYSTEQTFVAGVQVDLTPPVISDALISDITDTGAVITWKTDKPATGQVLVNEAGSETPYLMEPKVSLDTSHSVTLINLKPSVTYAFTLISKDAGGNQAMYELGKTFTTLDSFPVGLEIGKRAPDFTLPTVDGIHLSLSSFRGKLVMINFWQRACPACVGEMPLIQSFVDKETGEKVVIVAVNLGEKAEDVQSFIQRWNITFPVLLDEQKKVAVDYKFSKIPTTFFVDSQGIIKGIKNEAFTDLGDIESTVNSMFKTGENK
jgi:peroxiredoxin